MGISIYGNQSKGFIAFSSPLKYFIQVIWTYINDKFESARGDIDQFYRLLEANLIFGTDFVIYEPFYQV